MSDIVNIALICDDNYVMPSAVAIQSICNHFDAGRTYHFHIVCADLQPENEQVFDRFRADNVQVFIHRVSNEQFEKYRSSHARVAQKLSALYKCYLPDILPDIDKLLYIDGDVLICGDLSVLYDTDVSDYYAAVVEESATMYFRKEGVMSRIPRYFNSGMMLLNLSRMREEKIPEKIMDCFIHLTDGYFMDQDSFNVIFENHVLFLPQRYNLSVVSLLRLRLDNWTVDGANKRYGTSYRTARELFEDAQLIHFACPEKPWKNDRVPYATDWKRAYWQAPLTQHNLYPAPEARPDSCLLTVVLSEKDSTDVLPHLNKMQDTVRRLSPAMPGRVEIACVCISGSDTGSASLQEKVRGQHPETILFTQADAGLLSAVHGKYVTFVAGGEEPDTSVLLRMIKEAEDGQLDIVYSDAKNRERVNVYPGVYEGPELMRRLMRNDELYETEELALYVRDYLTEHSVSPFTSEIFPYQALISASRCTVLPAALLPEPAIRQFAGKKAQQALLKSAQGIKDKEPELYIFLLRRAYELFHLGFLYDWKLWDLHKYSIRQKIKKWLYKCHLDPVIKFVRKIKKSS